MQSAAQLELNFPPTETTYELKEIRVFPIFRLSTKPGHIAKKLTCRCIKSNTGDYATLSYETFHRSQAKAMGDDAVHQEFMNCLKNIINNPSNDS